MNVSLILRRGRMQRCGVTGISHRVCVACVASRSCEGCAGCLGACRSRKHVLWCAENEVSERASLLLATERNGGMRDD